MSDSALETALRSRATNSCELCGSQDDLVPLAVAPRSEGPDDHVLACAVCRPQIQGTTDLDSNHWFCLQEAVWSETAAVQVLGWRLLNRLSGENWAQSLLEQIYLDEATMAWAQAEATSGAADAAAPRTVDSNGAPLADGDSVTLIKDLDVKGTSFVAKRGTLVKGVRLTDNPEHVEGRVNKVSIVLKTCFLKKA
jgi:protein PhnA